MPKQSQSDRHLAMLIDGDNAQKKHLKLMIEEVSRYGTITIKRAYGDWTQSNLSGWREVMLTHAINPIQQWRYTTGKNATDSALIIDAMDILYSGNMQGFCIVSSDSDYTGLAMRIRESGLFVMGMGHQQTPEAFSKACDIFVYVENLGETNEILQKAQNPKKNAQLLKLIQRAFELSSSEDGWITLSELGSTLRRIDPSFDSRTYGHKTLSLLVQSLPKQISIRGLKKKGSSRISVYLRKS